MKSQVIYFQTWCFLINRSKAFSYFLNTHTPYVLIYCVLVFILIMCNSIVIDFNPVIRELYYLNDRCTDFIFAIILLMISHFIALWLVTLGIIVIFKNELIFYLWPSTWTIVWIFHMCLKGICIIYLLSICHIFHSSSTLLIMLFVSSISLLDCPVGLSC